jgi:hypothetical protein
MTLMRHANMQFSEIQKLEWEQLVWIYDEMMRSFNVDAKKEVKRGH